MTRQHGPLLHVLYAAEGTKSPIDIYGASTRQDNDSFLQQWLVALGRFPPVFSGNFGTKRGTDRGVGGSINWVDLSSMQAL